jgi:hypothetical protein
LHEALEQAVFNTGDNELDRLLETAREKFLHRSVATIPRHQPKCLKKHDGNVRIKDWKQRLEGGEISVSNRVHYETEAGSTAARASSRFRRTKAARQGSERRMNSGLELTSQGPGPRPSTQATIFEKGSPHTSLVDWRVKSAIGHLFGPI